MEICRFWTWKRSRNASSCYIAGPSLTFKHPHHIVDDFSRLAQHTHTQIEKQINELPSLSSSPESETDWFPSSTAQIPQKGIIQWLRDVATIPYPSGKNWVSDLVEAKSSWRSSTPGPRDVEENTRCLPLSKSPGNRQVSKVVQEHFQFKEIIANKSRTWKISIKNISFTAMKQLGEEVVETTYSKFSGHSSTKWCGHKCTSTPHMTAPLWAEHQFFNFSFQAVHLCLIAMSKHASSEDGRIPCSNGLFLDFHVGFWESTFFSQTNIKRLKHEVLNVWLPCFMWKSSFCMRANKSQPHLHLDNGLQSSLWHVRWRPWKTTTASVPQVSPFKWHAKSYPTKPKG